MIINNLIKPIKVAFSVDKNLYHSIKNIFGFYPDNIAPYKLALHHKSSPMITRTKTPIDLNNERLEFLGDAVIGAIVADIVFKSFPFKSEGFMSEMRSKIVSRSQLNKVSIKIGLDKLIEYQHDIRSKSLEGDAFEAIMAAIYIDKGYFFAKKVLKRIINELFDLRELENLNHNYKSQLLEWSQKNKQTLEYKVINTRGNNSSKQYIIRVFLDGKPMETGCDYNIKGAEQNASEKTLNKLINNEATTSSTVFND